MNFVVSIFCALFALTINSCGIGVRQDSYEPTAAVISSIIYSDPRADGSVVATISGTGFLRGDTVVVAQTNCTPVSVISSTQLQCILPSNPGPGASVVVTHHVTSAGGSGGSGGSGGTTLTFNTLFITSTAYGGNLGGLPGADAICSTRAAAGSKTNALGGTWIAVLSTSTVNAVDRVVVLSGGVKDVLGNTIVSSGASLWSSVLSHAPGTDENGNTVVNNAWTASYPTGQFNAIYHDCGGWTLTDSLGAHRANTGNPSATTSTWLDLAPTTCDESNQIYCINGN